MDRFGILNYRKIIIFGRKSWQYLVNELSVRTVATLLVLVMIFDGIMIPLNLSLLSPFEPQTAHADTASWDFSGGTNGSGNSNVVNPSSTLKLKPQWWNTSYAKRKKITVNTTDAAASGYSVKNDIDLESLRSASTLQNDLDDFRIVSQNRSTGANTDLDRDIVKGQGINLNGSSQYISIGNTASTTFASGSITLEAWIYPTRADDYIFGRGTNNANFGNYSLVLSASRLMFGYMNSASTQSHQYYTDNSMSLNNWHHIAVTYTFGTGSSIKTYIDGSLSSGSWLAGNGNELPTTSSQALEIGHWYGTPNGTNDVYWFSGGIDEVRISDNARYTSTFTPQQTHFTPDANTKGLWHLDNDAGDSSGKGNNGSPQNSPSYTEGKVIAKGTSGMGRVLTVNDAGLVGNWKMDNNWLDSQTNVTANNGTRFGTGTAFNTTTQKLGAAAGQFNGIDDYIDVGNDTSLNITGAITVGAWIKTSSSATNNIIYTKYGGGAFPTSPFIDTSNGYVRFLVGTNPYPSRTSSVTVNDGAWHHVAAIFSPSSKMDIYIDGALKNGALSGSIPASMNTSAANARIGTTGNGAAFFTGQIDEVAVYSRALSQSEIQEHYNAKNEVWFKTQSAIDASSNSEATGSHSYYMYYDNASATNPPENKSNVYHVYAGFEAGMDGFSGGTTVTSLAGEGNYSLQLPAGYSNGSTISWPSRPFTLETKMYLPSGGGSTETEVQYGTSLPAISAGFPTSDKWGYYTSGGWVNSNVAVTTSAWSDVKIQYNANNTYSAWQNGTLIISNQAAATYSSGNQIKFWGGPTTAYVDAVKIRAYSATNEPTSSFASAENTTTAYLSPGIWTSSSINPSNFYDWGTLTISKTTPGASGVAVDVLRSSDSTVLATNVATGTDLSSVVSNSETSIKLRATLTGGADTPTLSGLSLGYSAETTAPTNPSGLTVGTVTTTSVPLSWTASTDSGGSDLAGYKIERAPDSSGVPGTFAQIGTSATNSWSDNSTNNPSSPPDSNTKYWYRVRAYDNAGNNSDYSGEMNVDSNVKGLWHLNEGTGGTTADVSGNGNTGTLVIGATGTQTTTTQAWNNGVNGKLNGSLDLDGTDDYVNVATPSSLPNGSSGKTIEAWVKPDNTNPGGSIVALNNTAGSNQSFIMSLAEFGGAVYLFTDGRNGDNNLTISGDEIPAIGVWSHMAFTFSGTSWNYYLNGSLKKNGNFSTAINTNADNISIGRRADGANTGYHFPGQIDEVRISNTARTSTEIQNYYNESNPYPKGTNTLANTPTSPSATAASVSQMNVSWASGGSQDHYHVKSSLDSYASNIYNSTGTSTSQSSLVSGTQYTYRMYGVNADNVESSTYATVSKYTLSDPPTFPVANDGTSSSQIGVSWTDSATENHYHVYRDGVSGSGTLVYNTTGTSFDDTITGSHTYYIYSVNGDDVENSSYISDSGSTDNSLPTAPTALSVTAASTTQVDLSWTASSDGGGSGLAGYKIERALDNSGVPGAFAQIDTDTASPYPDTGRTVNTKYWYRVRAYDTAGNNSGYSGEMNVDSNVKGLWHFNEGSGQTAADASGNSNNGQLGSTAGSDANDPTWTTSGKHGNALSFDGIDDYVNIGNDSSLRVTGDVTIEAWIKTSFDGNYQVVVDDLGESPFTSYSLWLTPAGKLAWYDGGAWKVSQGSVNNGQWHQISSTLTSNILRFYIDGQEDQFNYAVPAIVATTDNKAIGARSDNNAYPFQGFIDEVRISNTARTGTEIQNYYNESNPYPKGTNTLADTPTSPSATAASVSQMNVSWASGGSQDHYHVKSSLDSYASNIYNSTSTSTSQTSLTSGAQYTYRIYGVNADDAQSSSYASVSKYTLSDPPTLPVATDGTYATKINVSWTASATANHYHVYRDGISGSGTLVHNTSALNFDDTITGSHTYYIYSVNGDDLENSSYISDSGATAPNAPTIGAASALSTTSIRWSFTDNASDEDGFKVHDPSHATKASAATPGLTYLDETGLSANTQYTRHVHAYNGAGDSAASSTASKYTKSLTPNVSADKSTSTWYNTTDVIFTNDATFGAAGVQYYRYVFDQSPTHTFTDTETQWSTSTLTRTATANGSWYLHVKAFNGDNVANGTQDYGPYYYDGSAPTDPSGLGATAASVSQINLSWTGSTDSGGANLIGYKIERAPDSGGSPGAFTQIDTDTASPYADTGRVANTKYWYRVRAYDGAANNSGYTSNVSKVTLSDAPTLPVATDGTYTDKINVSWTASATANHYHVYRDGVSGSGTLVHNSSATSFDDTITGSHTYYIYSVNNEDVENTSYISDTGVTNPIPTAPTIGTPSALSTTSIRWNFTDNADNETGFKVHDASHSTVASDATANLGYVNETSLTANTRYTRHVHAYNGAGDSNASSSVSKYTKAANPNIASDKNTTSWYNSSTIGFTSLSSFGAGGVAYYRYAINSFPVYVVDGAHNLWNSGDINSSTSSGIYYMHVRAYNADDEPTPQVTYGPYHFDLQSPTVQITSHSSGDYVKGKVTYEATISDNVGISDIGFFDNSLSNRIGDSSTTIFDTTQVSDGSRTLYAQVVDRAGNTVAHAIIINVDNTKPKTTPQKPGKQKGSAKPGAVKVKKGSSVKLYYRIDDRSSEATTEIKINKRYKRKSFKARVKRSLYIRNRRARLRRAYHKIKNKKDRTSKRRAKAFARQIRSYNRQLGRYNPYYIKTIKIYRKKVTTNKKIYYRYRATQKGIYRIALAAYDEANNRSSKPLVRWINVK